MPKRFINLNEINNWDRYSKNLEKLPYVKKYLNDIFKIWVQNNNNPLSVPWLRSLYENDFSYYDNNLKKLEEHIGKDNLYSLFNELKKQKKDPAGIITKIQSINGEIFVFSEIAKKYSRVEKIEKDGDWLCDDNTIISVKTKNELELNYQIIENILRSLYFIKENTVLRKYNNIDIQEGRDIDDKFRNNILIFLNSGLIDFIDFSDKQIFKWDYLKLETTKFFFNDGKQQGYINAEVQIFDNNIGRNISILLKEDRNGEKEEQKHQIKFILNKFNDENTLGVSFDTDVYWVNEDNKINWQILKKTIDDYLAKFNKSYRNLKRKNNKFIGWINIIIHPKYESYILDSKELKKDIKDIIGEKEYKIIITFIHQWNFSSKQNTVIFEIEGTK